MPTPDGAPPVERLGPADLADLLGAAAAGEENTGPLAGRPLLAVSLEEALPDAAQAGALGGLPCVVVGVHAGAGTPEAVPAGAFDVLLTDRPDPPRPWVACPGGVGTALGALSAAAWDSPAAALTLVQLLRIRDRLDLAGALWAESLAYSALQGGERFHRWLPDRRPRPKAAGDSPAVRTERQGATLEITLNRPEVHNAFNTAMRDGLVEALRLAAADPSIEAVELRGAGPSFCSGGDLGEFGTAPDPATAHLVRVTRSPARWLNAVSTRTTAFVHGHCTGAGVELAALAGRVVAAEGTSFALPEVGLGLVPGAGGTASLPPRIGRHRTAYLALCGASVDASTALAWGLIDAVGGPQSP